MSSAEIEAELRKVLHITEPQGSAKVPVDVDTGTAPQNSNRDQEKLYNNKPPVSSSGTECQSLVNTGTASLTSNKNNLLSKEGNTGSDTPSKKRTRRKKKVGHRDSSQDISLEIQTNDYRTQKGVMDAKLGCSPGRTSSAAKTSNNLQGDVQKHFPFGVASTEMVKASAAATVGSSTSTPENIQRPFPFTVIPQGAVKPSSNQIMNSNRHANTRTANSAAASGAVPASTVAPVPELCSIESKKSVENAVVASKQVHLRQDKMLCSTDVPSSAGVGKLPNDVVVPKVAGTTTVLPASSQQSAERIAPQDVEETIDKDLENSYIFPKKKKVPTATLR